MRSGGTPNLLFTPATSSTSPLMVLTSVTCGSTSCARSLSPVETMVSMPCALACRASVPMMSSASTPSMASSGQPRARTASWIGSICAARSSGMGGRCDL
ncbi:Uncharacterised protein [Bordetella pertussis]|nr:Uncharacterised protein [Bordetella pertussis]CFW28766.1 Uncharacterised protein [Bordetella pertussis]